CYAESADRRRSAHHRWPPLETRASACPEGRKEYFAGFWSPSRPSATVPLSGPVRVHPWRSPHDRTCRLSGTASVLRQGRRRPDAAPAAPERPASTKRTASTKRWFEHGPCEDYTVFAKELLAAAQRTERNRVALQYWEWASECRPG